MFRSLFVLVLFCLGYNVLGDDKTAEFSRDLEMKVSLSAEEVIQFEPVILKVSVRNVSHQNQKIYRALDPNRKYLKVFLIDSDGKHRQLKTSDIVNGEVESMELPTWVNRKGGVGTGVHRRILLSSNPGAWLDTPGKYKVYATFNYAEGKKVGSPVAAELTVKAAEGVNKDALERFRGFPQAKFIAKQTNCPDIANEFKAVIDKHSESAYVPWCYYLLARGFQNREVGHPLSNARNARMYYQALLKRFPEFPLKREVEYEIAREGFRLEKTDESLYEVKRLIKLDPLADNYEAELFLLYEARRVFDSAKGEITYEDLPSH